MTHADLWPTDDTPDGTVWCIECRIPAIVVDRIDARCVNGACAHYDFDLDPDAACDWPGCVELPFHADSRTGALRCDVHVHGDRWPDGAPRIELPGQLELL